MSSIDEESIIKLLKTNIFKQNNLYYMDSIGFNSRCPVYRSINHLYAQTFFKILDQSSLDYYVFAGTSIGYMRNKENIPWVDDYDIIIFEEEISKFEKFILPKLENVGLSPTLRRKGGGYQIFSKYGKHFFQCDVFYTKLENNFLKNTSNWGLYSRKKIHIDLVKPKQYIKIDGDLELPFFKSYEKDIEKEYGDVINECVIHIEHSPQLKINKYYEIVYKLFNKIKNDAIKNTYNLFNSHQYLNYFTLTTDKYRENNKLRDPMEKHINFLKYINQNDVKNIMYYI
jgi:hypothetical protein